MSMTVAVDAVTGIEAPRELANRRRSGGGVLGVVIGAYLQGRASERANTAHYAYILWSFLSHFADYPRRFHGYTL
jgi:hypothetical protein